MQICINAYIHAYIYSFINICIYIYTCKHLWMHNCLQNHTWIYLHMHVCSHDFHPTPSHACRCRCHCSGCSNPMLDTWLLAELLWHWQLDVPLEHHLCNSYLCPPCCMCTLSFVHARLTTVWSTFPPYCYAGAGAVSSMWCLFPFSSLHIIIGLCSYLTCKCIIINSPSHSQLPFTCIRVQVSLQWLLQYSAWHIGTCKTIMVLAARCATRASFMSRLLVCTLLHAHICFCSCSNC